MIASPTTPWSSSGGDLDPASIRRDALNAHRRFGEYGIIRHGTELDTAYTDTPADATLGTIGATLAGLLVVALRARSSARQVR